MPRLIQVREARSGLQVRLTLLDEAAPASAQALWALSAPGATYEAIHAIWTGPEISCPIDVSKYSIPIDVAGVPLENATSFPAAGDLVLVAAPRGRWKGMPRADIIDLGFFYGDGGRLLMPMGWIMGSVCARVVADDMNAYQTACRKIRAGGCCDLVFSREETR
jgi:Protein of unknown function (DUF3830)